MFRPSSASARGSITLRTTIPSLAVTVALLFWIAACSDDDQPTQASEPESVWGDVALPGVSSLGSVNDLDFIAGRGIAVGFEGTTSAQYNPLVMETTDLENFEKSVIGVLPAMGILTASTFDLGGRAIAVGSVGPPLFEPIVLDERDGWSLDAPDGSVGILESVITGGADAAWATGRGDGGLFLFSDGSDSWVVDDGGLPSPQEKGVLDLAFRHSVFYACGWDDGGPPYAVVLQNDGSGWALIDDPPPTATNPIFRAIIATTSGALLVGGSTEEFDNAGESILRARLLIRSSLAEWTEVVLPDPEGMESINDILIATNGDVYLGCGRDTARIWRFNGTTWLDEGPIGYGRIEAVAEDKDGGLWACGARFDARGATGSARPLILKRNP